MQPTRTKTSKSGEDFRRYCKRCILRKSSLQTGNSQLARGWQFSLWIKLIFHLFQISALCFLTFQQLSQAWEGAEKENLNSLSGNLDYQSFFLIPLPKTDISLDHHLCYLSTVWSVSCCISQDMLGYAAVTNIPQVLEALKKQWFMSQSCKV